MHFLLPLLFLLSPLTESGEETLISPPIYENGSQLDYEACRLLVLSGEILPISELMELTKELSNAHLLDAKLIKQNDRYYYQIESVGNNGVVNNFYMDASSGKVMTDSEVLE